MKKSYLLFFTIFSVVVSYGTFIYIADIYFDHKKTLISQNKLTQVETHYKIFQHNLNSFSDFVFDNKTYKDIIVDTMTKVSKTNDDEQINLLRAQLNEKLKNHYSYLKEHGVLQYHFVLPNNRSFLRMHKPTKYGDDLTTIREDYKYANEHKKISRGFSHGRVAHGFRNVYPVFSKKGQHIGAMEVSFSTDKLAEHLKVLSNIHSHFIIRKDIFKAKAWDRKDMVLKYKQSKENKNYMMHISKDYEDIVQLNNNKHIDQIRETIDQKLQTNEKFSEFTYVNDQSMIISFYPIKQNITKKTVAWIVSYENSTVLDELIQSIKAIKILILIILLILAFVIYKYLLQTIKLKQSSHELHKKTKEQDLLLSLFDKGDSVLFKWSNDQKWSVDYVSQSVKDLLGYDTAEFLNADIDYISCIHKDDLARVKDEVSKGSQKEGDFFAHQPYRIITKNKDIKWVLDYTTILRDENNHIVNYIGYIVDVTDQKNKEKILTEQSKLASMGEMIGNIAHQWRQPLSVISTASTGMQVQNEIGILTTETLHNTCSQINENAQYLSQTIDDFKNFIKDEKESTTFDLNETLKSFLNLMEPSIKTHYIDVIFDVPKNINLHGHQNELKQCFINIFNNSKDALSQLPKDHRTIHIQAVKKDKDKVTINFTDSGGGIQESVINKIFEPYFTTKHQSQGTGLGLHMTYNIIVNGMGGKIDVYNVEFECAQKK
ncbi:MAG: PAS domain-containing protein, partial [Campylobacterota bacterium]|nr:PAS domain-containing protein [Campylobacterota bacterium]